MRTSLRTQLLLLLTFCAVTLGFSQSASGTWALTANGNAATTGNVTAAAIGKGSNISTITHDANGANATGFGNSNTRNANRYYEYTITPSAGQGLLVNSISFTYGGSNTINAAVYYSLASDFAGATQLGSNLTAGTTMQTFTNTTLIAVPAGQTLRIRVFGWYGGASSRTFYNRDMAISGITCSNPSTVPTVTTSPSSQSICAGSTLTLISAFTNASSVQWYKDGNPIVGAVSATYTKANATVADSGTYTAQGSTGCRTVTTAAATVTVGAAAVGGTVAGSASVCSSGNSGTVTLSGHTGTVAHWERSADAAFTSPIIINNTTTSLSYTNLTSTTYYRAVVQNGVCLANSAAATITVTAPVNGGTIDGTTATCGSATGSLYLYDYTGTIVRWESSTDNFLSAPTHIANTQDYYEFSNLPTTTSFRVLLSSGGCSGYSPIMTVTPGASTTWNGTSWSNGIPTSGVSAIFAADYNQADHLRCCTVQVINNANVVIPSGYSIEVNGTIDVEAGSTFTLENNANLMQYSDTPNTSAITVKRNSSALMRQDYTLWSSPVEGQGLLSFSPLTVVSPTVRFYTYNTQTNLYSSVTGISSAEFDTAKGYLIRVPNNHPTTPTVWEGVFNGVPHTGTYTVTMVNDGFGQSFNLVGNPYPSPIEMNTFVADNWSSITGTLYFWRKTNNALSPSYCQWTAGTFVDNGEAEVYDPLDIIRTGQGFFVEANPGETQLVFNDGQRYDDNADQFFRAASVQKDRIWLNLTNAAGNFSQMAIVYVEGGNSDGQDMFDGRYINDGPIRLNSKINATEYAIQGRAPFVPSDVVPITFTVQAAGTYWLSIDHVDGLFVGDQNIYLKDNLLGIVHDLKASAYSFSTDAGTFDARFEVVYENLLSVGQPQLTNDTTIVYKQNGLFNVDAGQTILSSIHAYDLRGRLVASRKNIGESQTTIDLGQNEQVMILKIESADGQTVNKKVVN